MTRDVTFRGAAFRQGSTTVLQAINWSIRSGEHWAITGPVGAGKTMLLRALQRQLICTAGTVTYQLPGRLPGEGLVQQLRRQVAVVRFDELRTGAFDYGRFFYQQRYQASLLEGIATPATWLFGGAAPDSGAQPLIDRLGLASLLHQPLPTLSNGQTRKLLILNALLRHPDLLLLDDPFVGLDRRFRAELAGWLTELMRQHVQVVLVAAPDALPDGITHVLALANGRIAWQGSRADYVPPVETAVPLPALPAFRTAPALPRFTVAFQLADTSVRYGDTVLLDRINWTVRAGERWALLGPNGAGKSLIMSLLYGDHPQAYANRITLFDQPRRPTGTGAAGNIWAIKRQIGFVSPELHLYFPRHQPVRDVALTGLTDSLNVPTRISAEQEHDLRALLAYAGLTDLVERPFGTLSVGQQRLVLLVRALLKRPPCLLLDEPFQHLDGPTMQAMRHLIAAQPPTTTLLFITHYRHEIPDGVEYVAELDGGRLRTGRWPG